MVRPTSEMGSLNVLSKCENGPNHCKTFPFGSRVSSLDISEIKRPVTDCCSVGWIVVILLLQKADDDLMSRKVRFDKDGAVCDHFIIYNTGVSTRAFLTP